MKKTIIYILKWLLHEERPFIPKKRMPVPLSIPISVGSRGTLFVCILCCIGVNQNASSQILIGDNTIVSGSGNAKMAIDSSFTNNGDVQFTDQFTLHLNGEGSIDGDVFIEVPRIQMEGLAYEQQLNVTITDSLILIAGTINTNLDALLLITDSAGISTTGDSYILGTLSHEGLGQKFYPVGVGDNYAPITLTHEAGDEDVIVNVYANNESFPISDFTSDVAEVSPNWYWKLYVDGNYEGTTASLPILEDDAAWLEEGRYPVVVESDEFGQGTKNLGGSYQEGDGFVTGTVLAQKEVLLLGSIAEVEPVIHNIITPGDDLDNPYLVIENVAALGDNLVVLIDRWGNEVFSQKNFMNFNDTDNIYNGEFDDLPSGNYVCLLKFGNTTVSQMVSVIEK